MRNTPRTNLTTARAGAGLLACFVLGIPCCRSTAVADETEASAEVAVETDAESVSRYDPILRRAPFGRAPRQPTPEEIAAALALQQAARPDNAPSLADTIKLNALTLFRGVPAAGFTDTKARRTFLLLEGQTLGGYTLESVDFKNATARLTHDGLTEDIPMSFVASLPDDPVHKPEQAASPGSPPPAAPTPGDKAEAPASARAKGRPPITVDSVITPDAIAAATVVDASGEARISFRELHRIRVQQMNEKAEQERREREAIASAAKAKAEAEAKQKAEETKMILALEEQKVQEHRKQVIEAIKQGYDVAIDFELTPAEAKALADAGFAIPEEALKTEPDTSEPDPDPPKTDAPSP
ncbi:MAG: hypothetical protein ACOX9C_05050 [Kiritimatiellia bacterium]